MRVGGDARARLIGRLGHRYMSRASDILARVMATQRVDGAPGVFPTGGVSFGVVC